MTHKLIAKSAGPFKTGWFPVVQRDTGKRSAIINCPSCGEGYHLSHDIAADGTVTPSLVCPHDGCTYHEFVRLDGWEP